ncbi:MAG: hypothetical protein ACF8PG_12130 [Maioricimonas sp. JB045]|uniref:hypothetical protein n=1 Tax=Maioricimonas sp. JC845 TaxID=3232138 RepID=UPI00345A79F7
MLPELCQLELLESTELPERTLVAPLDVVRELRLSIGEMALNIHVGIGPAVLVSSDVYTAFQAWTQQQADAEPEENGDDFDDYLYN